VVERIKFQQEKEQYEDPGLQSPETRINQGKTR